MTDIKQIYTTGGRRVYLCFISVIDNSIYFKILKTKDLKQRKTVLFTIELWLLLTPGSKMGKDNNHVRHCARCVLWPLWRCDCDVKALLHNHVRTKNNHCAHCARCVLLTICDVLIVTSRLVATWWSTRPARVPSRMKWTHYRAYRARCHLNPGNGSLYPGGHFCPSPVNSRLFTDDYSRLPRIAGSSLNHMIRNCPTTSQETFNDGYNIHYCRIDCWILWPGVICIIHCDALWS